MFKGIAIKFQDIFKKLAKKGKLSRADVEDSLKEIKRALLAADVNFKVVKQIINNIKEKAVGEEILNSLNAQQQVIKIIRDEIREILDSADIEDLLKKKIFFLVGLQGSGKTTTIAKFAYFLNKRGFNPISVTIDHSRPAADKQLKVLLKNSNLPYYELDRKSVMDDLHQAIKLFEQDTNHNKLIIDTSGRLHIDDNLMQELKQIQKICPDGVFILVLDGLTGQDALNIAKNFNEQIELQGMILTKMEADVHGGNALSAKYITDVPILFLGTGEKIKDLEAFDKNRIADRIIGQGDILGLIEKAEELAQEEDMEKMQERLLKGKFTFMDFAKQIKSIKKIGGFSSILSGLPVNIGSALEGKEEDMENMLKNIEAIINSMTEQERQNPEVLNGSRRYRIASGSGTSVEDVNKIMKMYFQMNKMITQMSSKKGKMFKMLKNFNIGF